MSRLRFRAQLIHVYAKNYEGNGQTMLIRIVRYSLDGQSRSFVLSSLDVIFFIFSGLLLSQVRTVP
jgi:hypothetical protein